MVDKKVAKIILPSVLNKEFDYTYSDRGLCPGVRVLIDFRGKKRWGLVVETSRESNFSRLKSVIKVLDKGPLLNSQHFEFARALSRLYPYAYGEFLLMMVPPFLKTVKSYELDLSFPGDLGRSGSAGALKKSAPKRIFVKANYFKERYRLWRGEVKEALSKGSVLICFPQLSYLQQARQIIEADFKDNLVVLHSKLTSKELSEAFKRSRRKALLLGTRVSLFYYPLDLSLLIVEEENSPYYFQEEKPYHRLFDAAVTLCDIRENDLIASADHPSLSMYTALERSRFQLNEAPDKEKTIAVIDYDRTLKQGVINPVAREILQRAFDNGKRIVVIWNRKGFASGVICSHCRDVFQCRHCSGFLQMLASSEEALCPHCHRKVTLPKVCPKCRNGYFRGGAWGIERVSGAIRKIFPQIRVADWSKKTPQSECVLATSEILSTLYGESEFDQGLVLDADGVVMRVDYDATFKAFIYFKKLSLLCGEKLHVCTHNKEYYLYEYLNRHWRDFYNQELKIRQVLSLPPYGLLIKIVVRSPRENSLLKNVEKLYNELKNYFPDIYGPLKLAPFKLRDQYRYSLIMKAEKSFKTREIIKQIMNKVRLAGARAAVIIE
jgi:primosomal protein N' (replication factor Y) (superfamily II helicase)